MARRKTVPKLPAALDSAMGAVRVAIDPQLMERESCFGKVDFQARVITIDGAGSRETQWQTLGHELIHLILSDAGLNELLDHDVEEALCTAVGSWLAASVRNGTLSVRSPATPE
jgi:Zn-dependent peptidase ImmA (M78 family)